MLEDVPINAAIDSLLGRATARSGPERGDPSTGSTHRDRFNDWQRRKEEEAKNLLKSAQINPNIWSGLYGVEVDLGLVSTASTRSMPNSSQRKC